MKCGKAIFGLLAGLSLLLAGEVQTAEADFYFVSASSGKYLDNFYSTVIGSYIYQATYVRPKSSQQWDIRYADSSGGHVYYYIFNRDSLNKSRPRVMDVPGFSNENIPIQQYTLNRGRNQQWRFVKYEDNSIVTWKIVNRASDKVLDVPGFKTDTIPIQQYTDNSGLNQRWYLKPVN